MPKFITVRRTFLELQVPHDGGHQDPLSFTQKNTDPGSCLRYETFSLKGGGVWSPWEIFSVPSKACPLLARHWGPAVPSVPSYPAATPSSLRTLRRVEGTSQPVSLVTPTHRSLHAFTMPCEESTVIVPILQMRTLSPREVE